MMLEYVASGLSFLRLRFPETRVGALRDELNSLWRRVRGQHGHELSFLFNAHVEKIFAEPFKECFRGEGIHQVYADSGGLQMVTLGMKITPQLKDDVYEFQGKYSDCAMSFDEIPVSIIGARAVRGDTSNKYFDKDKFEFCAKETGRNVRRQIETFDKLKSDARPLFIAQGHNCDTYIKWTELAFSEIPKEMHSRIGGVAMGSAALGNGMFEDCKRAFYYTQLPIESTHLHLLGVGAISRLLPTTVFLDNGLYKDLHISYDSTTHTSGVQMGRYYHSNREWVTPTRKMNPAYTKIREDIQKNVPGYTWTDEDFYQLMQVTVRTHELKTGDPAPPIIIFNAYFVSTILNFIRHWEAIRNDFTLAQDITSPLEYAAFNSLRAVKTREDFDFWCSEVGKFLPSMPIRDEAPGTLDGLFD